MWRTSTSATVPSGEAVTGKHRPFGRPGSPVGKYDRLTAFEPSIRSLRPSSYVHVRRSHARDTRCAQHMRFRATAGDVQIGTRSNPLLAQITQEQNNKDNDNAHFPRINQQARPIRETRNCKSQVSRACELPPMPRAANHHTGDPPPLSMPHPFAHPLLRPKPIRRISLLNAFNYHLEVEGQNPRSCARNLSMVARTISETTLHSVRQQMHLIKNPDTSRRFTEARFNRTFSH